MQVKIEHIKS